MQMSGFRSRVKLCKFESGNLAITSQRRSCRLAQRRVPGIEKLSRNCVPHFNFTRVPPMNHNLRSIEALSRGFSRPLKRGTEIVAASIVSAGAPVNPPTFSSAERFNFLYSLDDHFCHSRVNRITLFFQLPPKYNASLSTGSGTEDRISLS